MDDIFSFDTKEASAEGRKMYVFKPVELVGGLEVPFKTASGEWWYITVLGQDSWTVRQAELDSERRVAMAVITGETVDDAFRDKEAAIKAAAATTGWFGISAGGEDIAYSHEAALELYTRLPWLANRVTNFSRNRGNFTIAPPKSSVKESAEAAD